MSWSQGSWTLTDGEWESLPYITSTGYLDAPDMTNIKIIWSIVDGTWEGLPYITLTGVTNSPDAFHIKTIWNFVSDNNYALPFVTYLENVGAFINCTNLTQVIIPPSVKYIDYYAFYNTGLTSVTIASDCVYFPTSFPEGCIVNFYD